MSKQALLLSTLTALITIVCGIVAIIGSILDRSTLIIGATIVLGCIALINLLANFYHRKSKPAQSETASSTRPAAVSQKSLEVH